MSEVALYAVDVEPLQHGGGGGHADRDRVSDELFTEAQGRFPHEPEGTPVCVFCNTYRTCLV